MPYQVTDAPDTLPYAQQLQAWMERFWRDQACQVCGAQDWRSEARLFLAPRLMPTDEPEGSGLAVVPGIGRALFPVVCLSCGQHIWISASIAGIEGSPIPGDLEGLG
jgi:hypothetical protein